jgi:hypothetical protein
MKNLRILVLALLIGVMLVTLFTATAPVKAGASTPLAPCIDRCGLDITHCCGGDPWCSTPYSSCDLYCERNGVWSCDSGWTCVSSCN